VANDKKFIAKNGIQGLDASVFTSITTSGKVGVGTASPVAGLDVLGTSGYTGTIHNHLYASGEGVRIFGKEATLDLLGEDGGDHASSVYFRNGTEGFAWINDPDSDSFQLRSFTSTGNDFNAHGTGSAISNLVSILDIGKTGDVGIGTDAPGEKLDVNGDVRVRGSGSTMAGTTVANASLLVGSSSVGIGIDDNEIVSSGSSLYIGPVSGFATIFREGNVEHMRVNNGGNVGIGTNSPLADLHVEGNAVIGTITGYETTHPGESGATLHVHNTATDGADTDGAVNFGDETQVIISTGAIDGGPQGYQGSLWFGTSDHPAGGSELDAGTQWNWKVAGIASKTDQDTGSQNVSYGNLEFYTKGLNNTSDAALAMIIDESQNVGIGTTSPLAMLDIKGNTTTYDGMAKIYLTDSNSNSNSRNWSIGNGGSAFGNLTFAVSAAKDGVAGDGTSINAMVIDNTGNVGIGNPAPDAKLTIGVDNSSSNVGYIRLRGHNTLEGNIYKSANYGIHMDTDSNSQGIRIDGGKLVLGMTGNVGIGTDDPKKQLHVLGGTGDSNSTTIRLGAAVDTDTNHTPKIELAETVDSSSNMHYGFSITGDGASTNNLLFRSHDNSTGGTIALSIDRATANVGIGTNDAGDDKLYVTGGRSRFEVQNVPNGAIGSNATAVIEATEAQIQLLGVDTGSWASNIVLTNAPASGNNKHWTMHHTPASNGRAANALQFRYLETNVGVYIGGDGTGTASETKMTIENGGNVGIATEAPSNVLHVHGSDSGITVSSDASDRPHIRLVNGTTEMLRISANNTYAAIGTPTDAQHFMVFKNDFIGTNTQTAPNAQIHIGTATAEGTAANPALQIGGANTYRLGFYTEAELGIIDAANGDNGLAIHTKTIGEAVRIDANGQVGIGTNNPLSDLHIHGDNNRLAFGAVTSNLAAQHRIEFWETATTATGADANGSIEYDGSTSYGGDGAILIRGYTTAAGQINGGGGQNSVIAGFSRSNNSFFTGKVGVGTNTPEHEVHIYNSTANGGNTAIKVHNANGSNAAAVILEGARTSDGADITQMLMKNSGNSVANIRAERRGVDGADLTFWTSAAGSGSVLTKYMTIDDAGRVGIGQGDPDSKFHLVDGNNTARLGDLDGNSTMSFRMSDSSTQPVEVQAFSNTLKLRTTPSGGVMTDRVTIDDNGQVGIGTGSPSSLLNLYKAAASPVLLTLHNYQSDINGGGFTQGSFIDFKMTDDNATFTPQVRIGMVIGDSDGGDGGIPSEGSGNFQIYTGNGTDASGGGNLDLHSRFGQNGRLKIFTPGNTTDGTYYSTLTINNTGSSTWSRIRFDRSGVARWGLALGTDDKFRISNLYTNGSTATPDDNCLVIDNNSDVGMGTGSPGAKLHVYGQAWFQSDSGMRVLSATSNPTLGANIYFSDQMPGQSQTGFIRYKHADGSVVAGSNEQMIFGGDQPVSDFLFEGDVHSTGDVVAYFSDPRLKDFHGNITGALDKVNSLGGYYFTENELAKEIGYRNDRMQVGVNADEVEAVLPEVVTTALVNENISQDKVRDYKTVKYEKMVPLLIEAIKELTEQNMEMKQRLDKLEGEA